MSVCAYEQARSVSRTSAKGRFYSALARPFSIVAGIGFAMTLWLLHVFFLSGIDFSAGRSQFFPWYACHDVWSV